ncbi:MAG: adaptor protein MecA [Bacillus sp. (in: firmicutes)]
MRLERVDDYTLKIFLTFDDLIEKGLSVTDITKSTEDAQNIIHEMIEWASEETGFPLIGAIELEIYSQFAQGLVILIKTSEDWFSDETDMAAYFMKEVDKKKLVYHFDCFEHVLSLFKIIKNKQPAFKSSLVYYENRYYIILEGIIEEEIDNMAAIVSEYGEVSRISNYQIEEYGSHLIRGNAIEKVNIFFGK